MWVKFNPHYKTQFKGCWIFTHTLSVIRLLARPRLSPSSSAAFPLSSQYPYPIRVRIPEVSSESEQWDSVLVRKCFRERSCEKRCRSRHQPQWLYARLAMSRSYLSSGGSSQRCRRRKRTSRCSGKTYEGWAAPACCQSLGVSGRKKWSANWWGLLPISITRHPKHT